ncbi:unnamed protein product [Chondrus crispus]|uniref:very-long-chain (3R)-3-hydroxyacyl-CoA dehydratase n=1 Tax=Chondrus crispus TaxID=2769 RepID=R7QJK1_CHOCR|nr:unnamed protein product [Chondrus crispus]CDF37580.1 unnamed protein product [Chondrus crispus]|eukprot:XP_005717451.1 unnamed protein product [Chondrus crispus]
MDLSKLYLNVYNTSQGFLWMRVLVSILWFLLLRLFRPNNSWTLQEVYYIYIPYAHRGQSLAWLEVMHAAFGLAGGGVATAFVQCLGRYVVLVYVVEPIAFMHSAWVTTIMLFAWALADVVRYLFYIQSYLSRPWQTVLWLRYSLFLILYPIGIVCEWLIYYFTLEYVDSQELFAVRLPNAWNFAFDFGIWNRIVLLMYLYFGVFMFTHMVQQRKKKLPAVR